MDLIDRQQATYSTRELLFKRLVGFIGLGANMNNRDLTLTNRMQLPDPCERGIARCGEIVTDQNLENALSPQP